MHPAMLRQALLGTDLALFCPLRLETVSALAGLASLQVPAQLPKLQICGR